jgi:hypothetical protein
VLAFADINFYWSLEMSDGNNDDNRTKNATSQDLVAGRRLYTPHPNEVARAAEEARELSLSGTATTQPFTQSPNDRVGEGAGVSSLLSSKELEKSLSSENLLTLELNAKQDSVLSQPFSIAGDDVASDLASLSSELDVRQPIQRTGGYVDLRESPEFRDILQRRSSDNVGSGQFSQDPRNARRSSESVSQGYGSKDSSKPNVGQGF